MLRPGARRQSSPRLTRSWKRGLRQAFQTPPPYSPSARPIDLIYTTIIIMIIITGHWLCCHVLKTCHIHTSTHKRVKVKTNSRNTNITHMHNIKTNGTYHCVKHEGLLGHSQHTLPSTTRIQVRTQL